MKKIKQIFKRQATTPLVHEPKQPEPSQAHQQVDDGPEIHEPAEHKKTDEKIIQLGKDNTLQTGLTSLHKDIIQNMNTTQSIVLTSDAKINADIAFIQLLIAFLNEARQQGATIRLAFEFTEECEALLGHSGLLETIKT